MKRHELAHVLRAAAKIANDVDLTTAKLPDGWQDRLVAFDREDAAPARARCLDKHDLVISKLVAMREEDLTFAVELLDAGLVDINTLRERAAELNCVPPAVQRRVRDWLKSWARRQNC